MRHPERWRNFGLACLLGGPVAILAAFELPQAAASGNLRAALFILGLMGILFGGLGALLAQQALRAKRRLAGGEAALARWRIEPEAWRAFLDYDRERNAQGPYSNEFTPREQVPAQGVDIVAGKEAIEIDASVHVLPRHGTPEITRAEFDESRLRPSVVEFDLYYPGGGAGASGVPQSPTRSCLRFPVPRDPKAEIEARALVAHFLQLTPGPATFFHGRGDGSDPEDLSKCWDCGFETHRFVSHCPQCGAVMQSRRWSRKLGKLLVVLGALISAGMLVALYYQLPLLLYPGRQIGDSRFDGSPELALGIMGIFGLLLVFGLTCLGYGIFQVKTGRRARLPVQIMVGIVSVLMLIAWLLRATGAGAH